MRTDQIALQLYTVRTLIAGDLAGTLRAVATAGYRAVEIAGLPATPAGDLRRLLDENALRPVAEHVAIDRLRDDFETVGARMEALGCSRVIVPWLPENERATVRGVRDFAAALNGFAREFADRGIRLGYHNHAFEFEPLDGSTILDLLLAELAPEVEIELDVYWASVGGHDPAPEIRRLAGRVRLLHMKDRGPGDEPRDAPAGAGTLDWAEIIHAGRDVGVEWYIAEQDEPIDALADVATAYRYLTSEATGDGVRGGAAVEPADDR
jgi:sugar phosphate isomerase/epimerase